MCFGPELIAVLGAASTAVSVIGAVRQGNAQADAYEYQADAARVEAANERDAAKDQADKIRKLARLQTGEAKTALAASGVAVDEGTAVLIDQDIRDRGEQDAFTELLNGNRKARTLEGQAGMYDSSASNARSAGRMNAAGNLFSGAASVASGWKKPVNQTSSSNLPGSAGTRIR